MHYLIIGSKRLFALYLVSFGLVGLGVATLKKYMYTSTWRRFRPQTLFIRSLNMERKLAAEIAGNFSFKKINAP